MLRLDGLRERLGGAAAGRLRSPAGQERLAEPGGRGVHVEPGRRAGAAPGSGPDEVAQLVVAGLLVRRQPLDLPASDRGSGTPSSRCGHRTCDGHRRPGGQGPGASEKSMIPRGPRAVQRRDRLDFRSGGRPSIAPACRPNGHHARSARKRLAGPPAEAFLPTSARGAGRAGLGGARCAPRDGRRLRRSPELRRGRDRPGAGGRRISRGRGGPARLRAPPPTSPGWAVRGSSWASPPGAMDSMVNHYTAHKRRRSDDAYTPGRRGRPPPGPGRRPSTPASPGRRSARTRPSSWAASRPRCGASPTTTTGTTASTPPSSSRRVPTCSSTARGSGRCWRSRGGSPRARTSAA